MSILSIFVLELFWCICFTPLTKIYGKVFDGGGGGHGGGGTNQHASLPLCDCIIFTNHSVEMRRPSSSTVQRSSLSVYRERCQFVNRSFSLLACQSASVSLPNCRWFTRLTNSASVCRALGRNTVRKTNSLSPPPPALDSLRTPRRLFPQSK